MTEIEQKALALVNEVRMERGCDALNLLGDDTTCEALCRTIEQHEAFRQEVSDAVEDYTDRLGVGELHFACKKLGQFIIPKPKPDPLVEIIGEINDGTWGETKAEYAAKLRAALEARGLEIREKNDDQ